MKALFLSFLLAASACYAADEICPRRVVVPGYPRLARMARLQGSVSVQIEIASDGRVVSAQASGTDRLLERAAEDNIRHWTFSPASPPGSSTSSRATVTYIYRLDGQEVYYDPPPRVVLDLPNRVEITSQPPMPQPTPTDAGRRK